MAKNRKRKMQLVKDSLVLVVVVVAIALAWHYYSSSVENRGFISAHFVSPAGAKSSELKLEVAASESERRKGLMFRRELKQERGMIFVFPTQTEQRLWMRNTYLSLDMVFLDSQLNVVGILRDVPILNETMRTINKPSKYVVELNAGVCAKLGIEVGSKLISAVELPQAS